MEPFIVETTCKINEEWFVFYFEKIIKRHVKNEDKQYLMMIDLISLLREANQI